MQFFMLSIAILCTSLFFTVYPSLVTLSHFFRDHLFGRKFSVCINPLTVDNKRKVCFETSVFLSTLRTPVSASPPGRKRKRRDVAIVLSLVRSRDLFLYFTLFDVCMSKYAPCFLWLNSPWEPFFYT